MVLLHVVDGFLAELEINGWDAKAVGLPSLEASPSTEKSMNYGHHRRRQRQRSWLRRGHGQNVNQTASGVIAQDNAWLMSKIARR
jgi:hypothetical protein